MTTMSALTHDMMEIYLVIAFTVGMILLILYGNGNK